MSRETGWNFDANQTGTGYGTRRQIESLINAYTLSPIIWFKALDITDEQRKKAEIIRRQWVTNGYKYEPREVEL